MTVDASLIDRLGAAALDGKQVVRDLHAAVKDARAVLKEIATERERVETMVKRAVVDEIDEAVKDQIDQLGKETRKAMDASVDKVLHEFEKLERSIFLGGVKRPDSNTFDLRKLAAG